MLSAGQSHHPRTGGQRDKSGLFREGLRLLKEQRDVLPRWFTLLKGQDEAGLECREKKSRR